MTSWPSGLRRCVKAAVFWAWVQIPPKSLLCIRSRFIGFLAYTLTSFSHQKTSMSKVACMLCVLLPFLFFSQLLNQKIIIKCV